MRVLSMAILWYIVVNENLYKENLCCNEVLYGWVILHPSIGGNFDWSVTIFYLIDRGARDMLWECATKMVQV